MKNKIQEIREKLIAQINDWLDSHELDEVYAIDIDEGCSPIIQEDSEDENNTYTLDMISRKKITTRAGEFTILLFDGGSSHANYTWTEDEISTDALADIAEFLEEYEI